MVALLVDDLVVRWTDVEGFGDEVVFFWDGWSDRDPWGALRLPPLFQLDYSLSHLPQLLHGRVTLLHLAHSIILTLTI